MSARIHVLERQLRDVESAVRSHRLPAGPGARELARHHAESVRFALDHPVALRRLHAATGAVADLSALDLLMPALLEQAMTMLGADMGSVLVVDPAADGLRLVAYSGFDETLAERWSVVADDSAVSWRALREDRQVFIPDAEIDEGFAPHRSDAASGGFRAVQATPLHDYTGRKLGVVSTHWREPRDPDPVDLRLLELYADYAGQRVASLLLDLPDLPAGPDDRDDDNRTAWQVTTSMLDALLDPPCVPPPAPTTVATESHDGAPVSVPLPRVGPFVRALPPHDRVGSLADLVVRDVFAAGLELDAARGMITDRAVRARVLRVTDALDQLLADVRSMALARDEEE